MSSAGNRFEALANAGVQRLKAYDPGHDLVAFRRRFGEHALVELGSNENSHGPSPAARHAVLDQLAGIFRYPDPLGGDLKRALALHLGVGVERILLGNGSHELLMQFGQVFSGPGVDVVASRYGFAVSALSRAMRRCDATPRRAARPRTRDGTGHDPSRCWRP